MYMYIIYVMFRMHYICIILHIEINPIKPDYLASCINRLKEKMHKIIPIDAKNKIQHPIIIML